MAHRPHRSADQWRTLIERQARSSQSAVEFCQRHDLGYASFMQWRSRLAKIAAPSDTSEPQETVPSFIELTNRTEPSSVAVDQHTDDTQAGNSTLLAEFDLGGGVRVRISRTG